MVASERRLRLRRRVGSGVGAGAGAVARWRDSRGTVVTLVASEALDLARFLADTGAFIKSLIPCSLAGLIPAEILQDFAVDVQPSPFGSNGYRKHFWSSCSV
jgi:hypothetical protein